MDENIVKMKMKKKKKKNDLRLYMYIRWVGVMAAPRSTLIFVVVTQKAHVYRHSIHHTRVA